MSDRTGYNNLRVQIYESGTTPIYDPGELPLAENVRLATLYPGGLYGAASFFIGRDPTRNWQIKQGQRVVLSNGLKTVYEGKIPSSANLWGDTSLGRTVNCNGLWGELMMKRTWRKRWADQRLGDDIWIWQTAATAAEKSTLNRDSQLKFTPKQLEWSNGHYAAVRYTMPTGETVKRVTYDYDFSELALESPNRVIFFDGDTVVYADLNNSIDGDTTTTNTISMTTADYVYVDLLADTTHAFVRFDFGGTVNANAATLTAEYSQDDGAGGITWAALTIADGTSSGGKTFAQDGDITFTRPADLGETAVNGVRKAWVRFITSANLTANVVINEIKVGQTQAWKLSLYNVGTASEVVTVTATATGSTDHTLATPSQSVELRFVSLAKQTPPNNGTIYAAITSMMVYSETGSINLTEIAKDIRAEIADLNSDETQIGSNTYSLVPFIADDHPTVADILMAAASYGDSSFNAWGYGLYASETATTPNGEPVLFIAQQPVLTTYEYIVYHEDTNLVPPLEIEWTADTLYNWIVVVYQDADGRTQYVSPDDNSNLKDTTSITNYGQRDYVLRVPGRHASSTTAVNAGRRFLAQYKNLQFRITSGIAVRGYIKAKEGYPIPACEIAAGKRVKIGDYIDDGSGTWQTHLITATDYDDASETCRISVGKPDHFGIFMAQLGRE